MAILSTAPLPYRPTLRFRGKAITQLQPMLVPTALAHPLKNTAVLIQIKESAQIGF